MPPRSSAKAREKESGRRPLSLLNREKSAVARRLEDRPRMKYPRSCSKLAQWITPFLFVALLGKYSQYKEPVVRGRRR